MSEEKAKAWPTKQYNGDAISYEDYETDLEAWAITKGYEEHLTSRDPKDFPRVTEQYTVPGGVTDDPNGPPGTVVPVEDEGEYRKKLSDDAKLARKIWAEAIIGYRGSARQTAKRSTKYDARALVSAVRKEHGTKSTKQVTSLVKHFVSKMKTPSTSINTFNSEWSDALRVLESNDMKLPEKFIVNLYLLSLGHRYKTLESMVQVMPAADRRLETVMKLAEDQFVEESDEAKQPNFALMASELESAGYFVHGPVGHNQQQNRQVAYETTETAPVCTNCGRKYHIKSECFAPGGGLGHMNREQRAQWLDKKRKSRMTSQTDSASAQLNQLKRQKRELESRLEKETEQALSVQEASHEIDMLNMKEQEQKYKRAMGVALAAIDKNIGLDKVQLPKEFEGIEIPPGTYSYEDDSDA